MEKKIVSPSKIASSLVGSWLVYGTLAYIIYRIGINIVTGVTESEIILMIAAVILDVLVEIFDWRLTNTAVFKKYGYSKNDVPEIFKKLVISFGVIIVISVALNCYSVKTEVDDILKKDTNIKVTNYYAQTFLDGKELEKYNVKMEQAISDAKNKAYTYFAVLETCFVVVTSVMLYFEKKALEKNALEDSVVDYNNVNI